MHRDTFSILLSQYMRRIRASASGVATEIGLSRESVNNWNLQGHMQVFVGAKGDKL
ncbi:hypothetical protein ACO0K9_03015 [Undibacterium sp. Ji50W]|uniref:hypothetical protein n=1 Tax=Undibacterium sp. Ji50W TaxID=3413041 RepID=UPI003BF34369